MKGFWTYEAPPTPPPPTGWTKDDWESLSPGMRREIVRQLYDLPNPAGDEERHRP
jgi:hypothetical protein